MLLALFYSIKWNAAHPHRTIHRLTLEQWRQMILSSRPALVPEWIWEPIWKKTTLNKAWMTFSFLIAIVETGSPDIPGCLELMWTRLTWTRRSACDTSYLLLLRALNARFQFYWRSPRSLLNTFSMASLVFTGHPSPLQHVCCGVLYSKP